MCGRSFILVGGGLMVWWIQFRECSDNNSQQLHRNNGNVKPVIDHQGAAILHLAEEVKTSALPLGEARYFLKPRNKGEMSYQGRQYPRQSDEHQRPLRQVRCFVKISSELPSPLRSWESRVRGILEFVRSHYSTEIVWTEVTQWAEDPSAITLVICPVTMRVGSNMNHALDGIIYPRQVVLLLLHPVEPHVNPPRRTDETLLGEEYSSLRAIIDVVYSQYEGPYQCDTNSAALNQLAKVFGIDLGQEPVLVRNFLKPPNEAEMSNQGRQYQVRQSDEHPRPLKQVRCFVKISSDLPFPESIVRGILELVRSHYSTEIVLTEVTQWPEDASTITLVICPVTMRVGSNMNHALDGIICPRQVVLLLLHPVEPHVNPPRRTDETLLGEEYSSLRAVIDVVYSQYEGPYQCDTNSAALNQLAEVFGIG